jgi:hypothetical protein
MTSLVSLSIIPPIFLLISRILRQWSMIKLTIQLIHPSTPESSASLVLLPLPISSIPDAEVLNSLSQLSNSMTELKLSRGSWTEDDDEPFSQVGMGGQKKVDVKREVDGMYM